MHFSFRYLFYALLIAAIFSSRLAWETDRNMVRRWVYPVTGHLSAWFTRCDAQAPRWLRTLAQDMAVRHDAPANQLAFVTADGKVSTCVNGWQDQPFVSPRVAQDTPMRLASLSKIVSFMGMAAPQAAQPDGWLDTPLVQVLGLSGPYADARVADIRVRQLLNHSAGFDRLKSVDPMTKMDHRPWCPYDVAQLSKTRLDYAPGARFAYHNLDFCLAAVAYEKHYGRSLWTALEQGLHLESYGLDWLERRDTSVQYNFMHENFYGPDFVQHLDWHAARAPMGLTGSAAGLARFIQDHRPLLALAQGQRDDAVPCDARRKGSCYDGFLNRVEVDGQPLWLQGGYLYGMAALFALDEAGNFIVWLGAGEGRPLSAAQERIQRALLAAQ